MAIGTTAAIIGAAALGTAGSVASGAMQAGAAKKAASAQERAAQEAAQVQRDSITQGRIDAYPWAFAGASALYQLMDEMGIARPETPMFPDLNSGPFAPKGADGNALYPSPGKMPMTKSLGFQETPGYRFAVEQGERGVTNNLAALGMKNSGAALKKLTEFRTGLANQEYGNYLNRLAAMAGMGQTQTNTTNSLTQTAAGNIGNTLQDAGAARASGYIGSANAWGNALASGTNQIGNALGYLSYGGRQNMFPAAPGGGLW